MSESKPGARHAGKATLPAPLGKSVNEAAHLISKRAFRGHQERLRLAVLEMLASGKTIDEVERWLVVQAIRSDA